MLPVRPCLVSFTDPEGIEHSVRVPAESLHEAAVEATADFRRGAFAQVSLGPATGFTIRVKAPEEEHTTQRRQSALLARWRRQEPE